MVLRQARIEGLLVVHPEEQQVASLVARLGVNF